jgi:pimeloyl-ACP methyl ester carboxylesterase
VVKAVERRLPSRPVPMMTTSGGVDLAYDLYGAGPALVLVHGITECRRSWDPLLAALAEQHTVLAADLRGHGESSDGPLYDLGAMAGDVHELVEELALDAPLLVGHSLGGAVVTAYAATFPARAVVNVDQALALAGFQDGLRQLEPLLRGDRASFEQAIAMVFEQLAGQLVGAERARIEALRRPSPDVVLGVWSLLLDSPAAEIDALIRAIATHVTVPYLSLHGIDPGADYEPWLRSLIPTATVEVWPDVGHYPHLVHPEQFLFRLQSFEATLGAAP